MDAIVQLKMQGKRRWSRIRQQIPGGFHAPVSPGRSA